MPLDQLARELLRIPLVVFSGELTDDMSENTAAEITRFRVPVGGQIVRMYGSYNIENGTGPSVIFSIRRVATDIVTLPLVDTVEEIQSVDTSVDVEFGETLSLMANCDNADNIFDGCLIVVEFRLALQDDS